MDSPAVTSPQALWSSTATVSGREYEGDKLVLWSRRDFFIVQMGKLSPKEGQAIFSTKKESEGVTWSPPSFISEQGDEQAHGDIEGTNEPVSKCVDK